MHIVDKIINNYQTNNDLYIGEKVTTSDHMLQTAMLAEKNHSSKSLICACLLHDYGHFVIEDPDLLVLKSLDGKHEEVGFGFLKDYFRQEVTEPIKLHVQAKKYLCRNKSYYDLLSDASKISLELQGGIMNDEEVRKFTSLKFCKDAAKARKMREVYDSTLGKVRYVHTERENVTQIHSYTQNCTIFITMEPELSITKKLQIITKIKKITSHL